MTAELELDGVSVHYGDNEAVADIDLRVEAGEVLAVIGPSGCGKSTLLRAVAGLEPLAAGQIRLAGHDLLTVPTHQRDLGLMFQDHALFAHLDVAANVGFGLEMKGMAGGDRVARVEEMLELVGLAGFGDRPIDELSGGEAQRVALARALAPAPGLLMLDEPLGSLDRVLREQLTADLRHLVRDLGLTTMHVTHDQTEAFALADRVVVLREGRIEQIGSPTDLWHRPTSAFVAEFVGHPNRWPLDGSDGGASIEVVPVTAISIVGPGSTRTGRRLEAAVEFVSFGDGRHTAEARVTGGDGPIGAEVVFESADRPEPGEPVTLKIDEAQVVRLRAD